MEEKAKKSKVSPVEAVKAYRVNKTVALLFLHLGSRQTVVEKRQFLSLAGF